MTQQKRLSLVLMLNVIMIGGLLLVGLRSHSLGVLAAGGDFIADSLAIGLGLFAVHMRDRHNSPQATTYVALINATLLLGITVFVLIQGVDRLLTHTPAVNGLSVCIVSLTSAMVMVAGVFILGSGAGKEDLHMRSVLLDTISDGLAAAAVAIVGAIIFFTHGVYWLDSAAAVAISLVIGYGAVNLLRDVYVSLKKHHKT